MAKLLELLNSFLNLLAQHSSAYKQLIEERNKLQQEKQDLKEIISEAEQKVEKAIQELQKLRL